ncbi:MAG: type II toxin-antitoxin system death-on-curing family toxin [Candidatus Devosia phytovorans]|uniref:Type II toxin-antitoxin system death-on-curing family toxin n=1 Tax=Candidatus Devosia phytovorans TaxID=3121372 RepID=A0AAJ5VSE2_9HYPH|nr:type II toxin-antitoxin system death-on-curing family toxin [Devosia sp.]WEK02703.1 MAG: type II toxin-antitoxin system death-on-curing family toxin [Devosia sp.]
MPSYLTLEEALRIHRRMLEEFGGAKGIRDAGLIESALLRPQTGYYADLIEEAAALWESLAMNHGFIDGNKRVAYACVELFLQLNGVDIYPGNDDIEAFIYRNIEGGTFNKDVIERWLHEHTEPFSLDQS